MKSIRHIVAAAVAVAPLCLSPVHAQQLVTYVGADGVTRHIVTPADPLPVSGSAAQDTRTAAANITAADAATSTVAGQNSVSQISGAPTANSSLTWALNGQSSVAITVTGAFVATAQIETSADAGLTYVASTAKQLGTAATTATVTGPGTFRVDVTGATNIRLRATAYTSGTLSAAATTSPAPGLAQIINPVPLRGADGTTAASASNGVPTSAGDGSSVTLGAKADAATCATTNTLMACLRQLHADMIAALTAKGSIAEGSTASDPPLYIGCRATTANPTAKTDGQVTAVRCGKDGKVTTTPFQPRELLSSSALLTLTSASETSLQAAGGSGVFLDMLWIKACNTSATDVRADVRDATAGTVIDSWYVKAGTCVGQSYPSPLKQTTANSAWTVQLSGAVTDVRVKAQFAQNQ